MGGVGSTGGDTVTKLAAEFYQLEQKGDRDSIDRMLFICDAMRAWMQPLRGRPLSMQQYHLVQTATGIVKEAQKLRLRRRQLTGDA